MNFRWSFANSETQANKPKLLPSATSLALLGNLLNETLVYSLSLLVRHLTAEQKRDLIAKLVKAQPEKSNRQIAKQVKVDDKTVAKVRNGMEGRSEIPNVEVRTDTKGRKQPAHKCQLEERNADAPRSLCRGDEGEACRPGLLAVRGGMEASGADWWTFHDKYALGKRRASERLMRLAQEEAADDE